MAAVSPLKYLHTPTAIGNTSLDWPRIAYLTLLSRALDDMEEEKLLQSRELIYQFSSRGHDMAQVILGSLLDQAGDAACGYYRSRPLMLTLGLDLEDALAGPMMRAGGLNDGRDIGVVFNLPRKNSACFLPMSGGVGHPVHTHIRLGPNPSCTSVISLVKPARQAPSASRWVATVPRPPTDSGRH